MLTSTRQGSAAGQASRVARRVACLGECMVELAERPDGLFARGFGGDTLNTAVYLARLGVPVDYLTVLGTDPLSDEMLATWEAEGVGTGLVLRLPERLPGLYLIQTDAAGERRFSYWRDSAPVRELFHLAEAARVEAALPGYDLVYLSGITLSLFDEPGRARLCVALDRVRARGGRIAFDTNFRPRGWPDRAAARAAYDAMLARSDIVLAGVEDHELLSGPATPEAIAARLSAAGVGEAVLKLATPGCLLLAGQAVAHVPATPVEAVVDTTAAGDSFAAAYLAARLAGESPEAAARAGHRLAAAVIGHRGAIIPRGAMPDGLVPPRPPDTERGMTRPELLLIEPMLPTLEAALDAAYVVHRLHAAGDPAALLAEAGPRIRAVVTGGATGLAREIADALPALEIIAVNGIGTDAIDLEHARARGIRVTTTPDVLTDDVADMAMALMLATARGLVAGDRHVREGRWAARHGLPLARKVSGARLGLLGFGRIGRAVARRAEGFGMEIAYSDVRQFADVAHRHEPALVALARWADVLIVAAAGGPGSRGIVDRAVLDALGPEGILVNVARGSVVDEAALVAALTEGRLGGAGLDVFADEPRVPEALLSLDNVVLQPHRASATVATREAMGRLVLDNLAAHFAGHPLPTPVV